MDILSKAEEWSLLYGDKLTASATTRFSHLYKGAVGGMEHVISVDNAGSYIELWREGENWYATTGAAIKQLPGLAKGAKLDEALDQFFKLTSKVSKSYKTPAKVAARRKKDIKTASRASMTKKGRRTKKATTDLYGKRVPKSYYDDWGGAKPDWEHKHGDAPSHTHSPAPSAHSHGGYEGSGLSRKPRGRVENAQMSCPKCKDKHPDYRGASGHLTMDKKTGATILEPHVKKAAVRKHQDSAGSTAHHKTASQRYNDRAERISRDNPGCGHFPCTPEKAARDHPNGTHRDGTPVKKAASGFARRTVTYGPSTPHDFPHGGDPITRRTERHIHKPHGTKTKAYSHTHQPGRVHKAEDTSRRPGMIWSNEHGGGAHRHTYTSEDMGVQKRPYSFQHEHEPMYHLQGRSSQTGRNQVGAKFLGKAGRKKDNLTQGGRISGGVTTPEVARTGGAGQPVGYGSTGSPQYSYASKARRAKKAVAQVGPDLKIGHKTPSNVSGGNVNPMENKGTGSALPQRPGMPSGPHTHSAGYGRVSQHTHPVAGPHEHREPTEYTQTRRENKGVPFYSGSRAHGGTNRTGNARHSHTSYKPTVEPRGAMMPHGPTRAYSHTHGYGTHQDISPGEEAGGKDRSFTAKMVRMTVKDLHQLVGKASVPHVADPSYTHGRNNSYHSHTTNTGDSHTHTHKKGFHSSGSVGNSGGLGSSFAYGQKGGGQRRGGFTESPAREKVQKNTSYPDTKKPHGDAFNWHSHPHSGLKTYSHAHDRGAHDNNPLSVAGAHGPMKKAGGYDAPPGQETVSSVNPHKGGLHAHPDLSAKTHGQTFSHDHGPSEGHGFGMQYDNDGGWRSPFKRGKPLDTTWTRAPSRTASERAGSDKGAFRKNIMGLDTPEKPKTYASHGSENSRQGHVHSQPGLSTDKDATTYRHIHPAQSHTHGGSISFPRKEDDCTACSEVSKAVAEVAKLEKDQHHCPTCGTESNKPDQHAPSCPGYGKKNSTTNMTSFKRLPYTGPEEKPRTGRFK